MSATPCCLAALRTCRPMRPKPLMPTRIAIPFLSLWLPPIAQCRRPAEGHKANNACTAFAERGSARVQCGGSRHNIIDDDDVRAAKHAPRCRARGECARNVAESVRWCQPRLCLRVTRPNERIVPHGKQPASTELRGEPRALIVAALALTLCR